MGDFEMMFDLNNDVNTRDEYLFGKYDKEAYRYGGTRSISGLSLEDLDYLMENRFLDPEECQNCSPSAKEIRDFIEKHPSFSAFGYAVSPERRDYRITLEGIERQEGGEIDNIDELKDFVMFARFADELDIDTGYAWWD